MKGVILCAGAGTRLRPLTYTAAKHLIPVANKPILFYAVEALVGAGVTDIALVVGSTGDQIRAAAGSGERFGARITYVEQRQPLGLAHAVKVCREFTGESAFVVFLGDNIIEGGVADFVSSFRDSDAHAQIMLSPVDDPSRYGIAAISDDRIVRLVEKPKKDPPSNLGVVGVYAFRPEIYESIGSLSPSARGELEITDAIQSLIDRGLTVRPFRLERWWKDTGKPEDVLEANHWLLEGLVGSVAGQVDEESRIVGRVIIGHGTIVRRSHIRGPVIIGAGCVIEDAFVGPFSSISDNVTVRATEVENSILLPGCSVVGLDARIDSSLIGNNASVTRDHGLPRSYRLILGDESQVEVR